MLDFPKFLDAENLSVESKRKATSLQNPNEVHTMQHLFRPLALLIAMSLLPVKAYAGANASEDTFEHTIQPLLKTYCYRCHNATESKGELNLAAFGTGDKLAADPERLQDLLDAISEGFMPPMDAKLQPSDAERTRITEWIQERLNRIAAESAGDPGKVVIRRLTNAELNYTLNDLTGIERDWTKDFPRDSSGGEGFSNTGQTLQMSASQIEKYLALAQQLADHAFLLPGSGPVFWETPVTTIPNTEQARLMLSRLDQFCRENQLDYKDVTPREQITSYAYPDQKHITRPGYAHMRGYQSFSSDVPGATLSFIGSTHRLFYRTEKLNPTPFSFLIHRGDISASKDKRELDPRMLTTWRNLWLDFRHATGYARPAKISLLHRWFSHRPYRLGDNPQLEISMKNWKVGNGKSPDGYKRHSLDPSVDLSFTVIALADYLKDIRTFSPEELQVYANIQHSRDGESRTLMVPNHDAFDAFLQLSFDDRQLERIWQIVCDPESRLAKRFGGVPSEDLQSEWKSWTKQQNDWKSDVVSSAQAAMCRFATRAWRRPLRDSERNAIATLINKAMKQGQSLSGAMRLSLMRIVLSPHFLYRMELGKITTVENETGIRALNDFELANRLSYFLWSSLPDQELWDVAERGELSNPTVLAAQARRMLKDRRMRRFSREMFGQWLGFYDFQEFDRPDPNRFPEFDAELRRQMDNEAMDFCTDLVAKDRDIRLLLNADYSFLPRRLAGHYGVSLSGNEEAWSQFGQKGDPTGLVTAPRISLKETNRRGVLGWGAILTATSHPLRTSPVLRGNWILDDLLGIPTPPPPNAVPDLPMDEKNDEGLTVAQLLARHRSDKACAVCHDRIDPFGLALETFDPIGRYRERDLNGKQIETRIQLHDETLVENSTGLMDYLGQEKQRRLFTRRFCRKILGYALGRTVLPGDEPLLAEIEKKLQANNYRFSVIVESIITSRQFRHLRHDPLPTPAEKDKP